jgi:integrase
VKGFIRTREGKNGKRYQVLATVDGRRRSLGTFRKKKDAEAALKKAEGELAAGTFGRETLTLGEFYADRWYPAKSKSLKGSTLKDYESTFKGHILPAFEDKHLAEIKPLDVQEWINGLELSPSSVHRCYRYLRALLNQAVKLDLIQSSPCKGIELPRVDRPELDFLKPSEVRLLLENMREPERTLIATLAYSGLRIGEGLALAWRHIDFENHVVIVSRSWNIHNGFDKPKSSASRRAVPLLPYPEKILGEYYQREGSPDPDALLFTHDGEQPLDPSNVRREFEKGLKAAGLKHVTIHSLRHGYASLLLSKGISIKAVQRCLGHGSAALTLSTYSHLLGDDLGSGALRVNAEIEGEGGKVLHLPQSGENR